MPMLAALLACLLVILVLFASQFLYVFAQAWVAWRFGIGVREVSVGLGPTLFRRRFEHWSFRLAAIPLSSYTSMHGESDGAADDYDCTEPQPDGFRTAPLHQKLALLIVGPLTTLALGAFCLGIPIWLNANRLSVSPPEDSMIRPCGVGGLVIEPVPATWESQLEFVRDTSLEVLVRLLTFRSLNGFGGIVAFTATCAAAAAVDFDAVLSSLGALLIYFGIMNLLPIPVLNGGHMVLCLVEACLGKRLAMPALIAINGAGLIVLLFLMGRIFLADGFWLYRVWFGP